MSQTERHAPETPATRFLRQHRIAFSSHVYDYEEHGGTRVSARELNVSEHAVVKTLIMEDEHAHPMVVLMHGDRKVSAKELARQIGCKKVEACKPDVANRHSGYLIGGTETEATVRNQFIRPGAKPVLLDYSMRKTPAGWKIYDIVVEGVSLVLTYRSEFDAVVKQDGIDGLIKRLAQKNTPAAIGGTGK